MNCYVDSFVADVLEKSSELKKMAGNAQLKAVLHDISSASDQRKKLQEYRKNSEFEQICQLLLETVEYNAV